MAKPILSTLVQLQAELDALQQRVVIERRQIARLRASVRQSVAESKDLVRRITRQQGPKNS